MRNAVAPAAAWYSHSEAMSRSVAQSDSGLTKLHAQFRYALVLSGLSLNQWILVLVLMFGS